MSNKNKLVPDNIIKGGYQVITPEKPEVSPADVGTWGTAIPSAPASENSSENQPNRVNDSNK